MGKKNKKSRSKKRLEELIKKVDSLSTKLDNAFEAKEKEQSDGFDRFVKKMEMYIAGSKTLLQLGAASLAATLIFIDKIKGVKNVQEIPLLLGFVWTLMGLTIITSALYQYLAIKCIEYRFNIGFVINNFFIKYLTKNPGVIFGTSMVMFILGIIAFVVFILTF